MNLQDIFGKYAGQQLKSPLRMTCETDDLLDEIKTTASQHGLTLRIQWPHSCGDCRQNMNRVNLAVTDAGNGKLSIENKFWLG